MSEVNFELQTLCLFPLDVKETELPLSEMANKKMLLANDTCVDLGKKKQRGLHIVVSRAPIVVLL